MDTISVVTFYRFVWLADPMALRQQLLARCQALALKGTVLLANEGINATLCGPSESLALLVEELRSDARFSNLAPRWLEATHYPFRKLRVRLKREIVTLGQPEVNLNKPTGHEVSPQDWHALLNDPATLVIDTRNKYEIAIGQFPGAVNPETERFRDFPDWVNAHLDPARHKRVAMYCTGGIRCEKASTWLLEQGFADVYQLQGGILRYLDEMPAAQSRWQGACFVFDERVSLTHGNHEGMQELCLGCGQPLQPGDKDHPHFEVGLGCPRCYKTLTQDRRARLQERRRQAQAPTSES